MRKASLLCVALAAGFPVVAAAQTDVQEIRKAVEELTRRRAEDQARIRDLEARLKQFEDELKTARTAPAAAAPAFPPPSAPAASAPASQQAAQRHGVPPAQQQTKGALSNTFNPAIGVALMGNLSHFSRDPARARIPGFMLGEEAKTPGDQGFSLGESEINLSANVDHVLYGELTLSHPRTGGVEVEEAFVQTMALPYGLTAKAGRFFSGIGYLNEQHAHTWDFVDAPLPYRAMLNTQFRDDGLQARWLAPTDFFLEFGAEGLRGESFPATPSNHGKGAFSGFVRTGGDVGADHSWLASLSYLYANPNRRLTGSDVFSGTTRLGIGSLVWKWAPDGNPKERNLKLQGEFFLRQEEGLFNDLPYKGDQMGWYLQSVYQFMPRWRIGARYDQLWSERLGPDFVGTEISDLDKEPHRLSGLLEYDTSEFGRIRLQYNYDRAAPETNHEVLLNYTVSLGAHGAHKF